MQELNAMLLNEGNSGNQQHENNDNLGDKKIENEEKNQYITKRNVDVDAEHSPTKDSDHITSQQSKQIVFECNTTVRGIIGGDGFNPQDEGLIRIELHPEWAPIGAARVKDLVADHFFDDIPLFRGLANFLIQFGINTKNATKNKYWEWPHTIADDYNPNIPDANKEKQTGSNIPPFTDGIVSFAGSGKDSRSTHLFMTLGTQRRLGKAPWEVPVGRVVGKGSLKVLHTIYTGYGDQPQQQLMNPGQEGGPAKVAEYLKDNFPKLDWINTCQFV